MEKQTQQQTKNKMVKERKRKYWEPSMLSFALTREAAGHILACTGKGA